MEKLPESRALFERLQTKRAELGAIVDPLRAERDAIVQQIQPLEVEAKVLADQIKVHMPELARLDNEIGALAKALGGKAMSGG